MGGPGPADVGQIVHSILKSFFQELIDRGFLFLGKSAADLPSIRSADTAPILEAAIQKAFREFEQKNPVGYPLAWKILQDDIAALLQAAVTRDLQELEETGYRPIALECEATDQLPASWPLPLSGLSISGRMDRIDYQPVQNRYRVIDYKLKFGKAPSPEDKNLLRSALRAQRLQPPFYLLLGKEYVSSTRGGAKLAMDAAFYFLASQWENGPLAVERLAGDAWEGKSGSLLLETVGSLVTAMRGGLFFIRPGDQCRNCEVSETCRRNHRPTLWRAERDPRSVTLSELVKKTPNEE
jgi:ATP-dependent helicase/nuclease subunit B